MSQKNRALGVPGNIPTSCNVRTFCEKASLADAKIAISSTLASMACAKYSRLGTRPDNFSLPDFSLRSSDSARTTSALLAMFGTHCGDTKLATSILEQPAATSLVISVTLSATDTATASFWSPSRGPTSTIWTAAGSGILCAAAAADVAEKNVRNGRCC